MNHPPVQTPTPSEDSPELMTVKETADYLRIPVPSVYYLVHHGQLPGIQIGARWRIRRSLLDRDVLHLSDEAGQPRVLVVDDDPAIHTLFRQLLKRAHLARLAVDSGAEAIDLVRKEKFDLVFLDLNLPDVPGDEVYMELKRLHPDLPIVVITGYPDSQILAKILSTGPVTVIIKPIEFEQLNMALKQLGHKGAEPAVGSGRDRELATSGACAGAPFRFGGGGHRAG